MKLKPAVSHSNLKFAPRWSFTWDIWNYLRPNNFKCPVTQQNWFYMVTEHTIYPNNFKVTSDIPTTLFSKILSALSVVSVLLQKKMLKLALSFHAHLPEIVTLSLRPGGVRSRTRGPCPRFMEAEDARIPLKWDNTHTGLSFVPAN